MGGVSPRPRDLIHLWCGTGSGANGGTGRMGGASSLPCGQSSALRQVRVAARVWWAQPHHCHTVLRTTDGRSSARGGTNRVGGASPRPRFYSGQMNVGGLLHEAREEVYGQVMTCRTKHGPGAELRGVAYPRLETCMAQHGHGALLKGGRYTPALHCCWF